jgi:hypothetical protein
VLTGWNQSATVVAVDYVGLTLRLVRIQALSNQLRKAAETVGQACVGKFPGDAACPPIRVVQLELPPAFFEIVINVNEPANMMPRRGGCLA